jgi:hypothetical protein
MRNRMVEGERSKNDISDPRDREKRFHAPSLREETAGNCNKQQKSE